MSKNIAHAQQDGLAHERTPLTYSQGAYDGDDNDDDDDGDEEEDTLDGLLASESFRALKPNLRKEARAAERLSVRLLAVGDDDSDEEDRILRESLNLTKSSSAGGLPGRPSVGSLGALSSASAGTGGYQPPLSPRRESLGLSYLEEEAAKEQFDAQRRICTMVAVVAAGLAAIVAALVIGVAVIGPPNQPVGSYVLVERQEGMEFFNYYTFYEGRDSVGSNGYNMYINMQRAQEIGIVNVTYEKDVLDVYARRRARKKGRRRRKLLAGNNTKKNSSSATVPSSVSGSSANAVNNSINNANTSNGEFEIAKDTYQEIEDPDGEDIGSEDIQEAESSEKDQPFVYMGSAPTKAGPRDSIRLEGNRRFNRGLFIIDIRHMPAGCGVWPAFWLTDEANWPVNGEIDIVEGVNYQSVAKTALHATSGCTMNDIPLGTMTGTWDTAQGIPDSKTGIPDMTLRYAKNCFVYDPHQWLNQGCVAVDTAGGTLGVPLNQKGGGVYALEWDPINRHIRTWVFTPHSKLPSNLIDAIRTAGEASADRRVMPDPDEWPLPYGYFSIGDGTECTASHFRNMRLVFNTAFCGSVAGNRYQMDCKKQAAQFGTCNEYVKSEPEELKKAYWKIRGVYVYERAWERTWLK